MVKTPTTGIRLDPDQLKALQELKKKTGVPIAAAVRIALRDYLEKQTTQLSDKPTTPNKAAQAEPQMTDAERAAFLARITEVKNFRPKE